MVRQWQTLFYDGRYSNTDLTLAQRVPDFVKLADAYGALGLRCDAAEDVDDTISRPSRSTTAPSSSTSSVHATRWCGRWSPPGEQRRRSQCRRGHRARAWDREE